MLRDVLVDELKPRRLGIYNETLLITQQGQNQFDVGLTEYFPNTDDR